MTLVPGTDFSSSGTSDIVLHVYVAGELWGTFTVTYSTQDLDTFSEPAGLDNNKKHSSHG